MEGLNSLREENRFNLERLFEIREGVSSKKDILVELSLDDIHFYLGFDEIYRALLNTNIKIIDERFNEDIVIVSQPPQLIQVEERVGVPVEPPTEEVEDDNTSL